MHRISQYISFSAALLICAVALCSSSAFSAELSPSTRLRLMHQLTQSRGEPSPYQPLMLMVSADSVITQMQDLGVVIYGRRDNIVLTTIPRERLSEVLDLPGILNAEASGDMSACMDKARPFGRVDAVQTGLDGLDREYNGRGVVVGFTDIGFDNTHIAFKDHVSALYDYDTEHALRRVANTPSAIRRWTTDNPDEWHATHVANILAGSYKESPYYGVATGAEIVATTSRLYDVGILAGVEDVIAYAKKRNKPAVVNMSIGNSLGPHDGSSLFCQYLSRCAEDAVICLSAGNTGNTQGYAYKDLTDNGEITRVLVNSLITWNGYDVMGMTEMWSATSQPFDFRLEVFDMTSKEIVYTSPWISEVDSTYISFTPDDERWAQMFTGRVIAEWDVSPLNDRFCVATYYDTHTEIPCESSGGQWSQFYTCLAIRSLPGAPKTHVDIFADSHQSMIGLATSADAPVFVHGGSISDFCTAEGVIAVGACSSRNTAPSLMSDTQQSWNFHVDNVAQFSSYSNVPTIKRLPHISAPGNYVVSAMSGEYLALHPDWNSHLSAVNLVDGKYYYWAAECGTSMASPYVAGVIALWLQADPSLTTERIIEIAQSTALTDFPDISNPRWGAGCIDAVAGLQHVIASVPSAAADDESKGRRRIYSLSGIELNPDHPLSPGIYIVVDPGQAPKKIKIP